jgi:ABC-2 type transport system ATP-binding protein
MSGAHDTAIEARALTRRHGDLVALDALDLDVAAGEFVALLGANGAGKSTTIGLLTTLLAPDAGTARVAGFDVRRDARSVRRAIGIVFQDPTLDVHLSVEENLRFHATLYDVPARAARPRIDELLEALGIADRRRSLVRTLSGGLRRRVEVARALLHRPDVLFLDEPTVGLDPRARATLAELVDEVRRSHGTTTLLTTHYLAEAERCDRVAILDRGRLVAFDAPDALRTAHGDGPHATLDDVFLALTGRDLDEPDADRATQGRLQDRQRSGPRT